MSGPDVDDESGTQTGPPPSMRTRVLTLAGPAVAPLVISWLVTALWVVSFGGSDPLDDGNPFDVIPGWFALSVPVVGLDAAGVQARRSHPMAASRNPWIASLRLTLVIVALFVIGVIVGVGAGGLFLLGLWLALSGYPVALYLCGVLAFRRLGPGRRP